MMTFVALAFAWIVYFALFWKPLRGLKSSRESDRLSWLGTGLQFLAAGLLPLFARYDAWPPVWDVSFKAAAMVLVIGSLVLTRSALKELGRQWSLQAQVSQGHRLITEGPFAWVRHPLYLAFFLLVSGSGLALSTGVGIALALPICLAGAVIRIFVEERLLMKVFGAAYRDYARRVPALLPTGRG